MKRVRQFIKGCISNITGVDDSLADKYLNARERELFNMLPNHEKRHALDTAATAAGLECEGNKDLIIKAALLHDIGKVGSGIGLIKKSILVLTVKCLPRLSMYLSKYLNMYNIYYAHPHMGAELLKNIGTDEEVILLVKYHHSEKHNDIYGIELLKKADSMN